jgi:hypothetical protein
MIISKMKPRGNMRTFYDPTTLTFFCQDNQCQISPPLPLLQSQGKIPLTGEDYNTMYYENYNQVT